MSDSESSPSEAFDASKFEKFVSVIYRSCCEAQGRSGVLSMQDCRRLNKSRDCLNKTITEFAEGKLTSFDKDIVESIQFLILACNMQQSKATFSVDGSVMLLEMLEVLEEWINKHKSPKLKLQEAKEKKKNR